MSLGRGETTRSVSRAAALEDLKDEPPNNSMQWMAFTLSQPPGVTHPREVGRTHYAPWATVVRLSDVQLSSSSSYSRTRGFCRGVRAPRGRRGRRLLPPRRRRRVVRASLAVGAPLERRIARRRGSGAIPIASQTLTNEPGQRRSSRRNHRSVSSRSDRSSRGALATSLRKQTIASVSNASMSRRSGSASAAPRGAPGS